MIDEKTEVVCRPLINRHSIVTSRDRRTMWNRRIEQWDARLFVCSHRSLIHSLAPHCSVLLRTARVARSLVYSGAHEKEVLWNRTRRFHITLTHCAVILNTCGDEDVDGGVERQRVDGGKMAVVMTNHFVHFQIPTFHQFILSGAERWLKVRRFI